MFKIPCFNANDSKMIVTVNGSVRVTHKFLPWLADHAMATEIAKRDPFQNPSDRE